MASQSSSLSLSVVTQCPTINPFKRDKPVLKDTACGQQTRFYSNGPTGVITLKRWRTALHHRYLHLLQARGGYTVIWRDTDHRNDPVECGDIYLDCSAPDLPDDLGKTFIQVRGDEKPKITITLYFHVRRKTGGTCLIQGHNKDAWVISEYESLCTFVQQLKDGCADPAENVPVDMPVGVSRDRQIGSAPPIVTLPDTPPRTSNEPEPECSATASDLLLQLFPLSASQVDDCNPVSPSALQRSNTEPPTTNPMPEALTVSIDNISPAHSAPTSGQTSSLLFTPSPPPSPGETLQRDYRLSSTLTNVLLGQSSVTLVASPIVLYTASVSDVAQEGVSSARAPVACTEEGSASCELATGCSDSKPTISMLMPRLAAVESLQQELYHLQSKTQERLDQLENQVREISVTVASDLQMSESFVRNKLSQIQDQLTELSDSHCHLHDTLQSLNSAHDSDTYFIHDVRGHVERLEAEIPSHTLAQLNNELNESVPEETPAPPSLTDGAKEITDGGDVNPATAGGEVIPVRITPPKNLSSSSTRKDQASGGLLITVHAPPKEAEKQAEISGAGERDHAERNGNRINGVRPQTLIRPPPSEEILTHHVMADTTTLVIGCSVLRNVKGEKMTMCQGERVQVISVSGLQTSHLTDWCMKQVPSPRVQLVTFHVGVNDCKQREITSQQWEKLVTACITAFPKARVQASSILPAGQGRNSRLNQRIFPSNANLCHVAKKLGASFIDNTGIFHTANGLPRKALYRVDNNGRHDPIHPSHVGTRRLGGNIKYGGEDGHRTTSQRDATSPNVTTAKQLYSDIAAGRAPVGKSSAVQKHHQQQQPKQRCPQQEQNELQQQQLQLEQRQPPQQQQQEPQEQHLQLQPIQEHQDTSVLAPDWLQQQQLMYPPVTPWQYQPLPSVAHWTNHPPSSVYQQPGNGTYVPYYPSYPASIIGGAQWAQFVNGVRAY